MRLNLGCGENLEGWAGYVNIDIRDIDGAIKRDISDRESMMVFAKAKEICAFDIIEHFPRERSREILELWADLLAPGGILKIRCPDLLHAVDVRLSDEWLELLVYGGQDYEENFHKCGFTTAMMKKILTEIGLEVVHEELSRAGNLEIWAVKP